MIREIVQGASANWKIQLSVYKPSDGWILKYYFRGPGSGIDLTATSDADEFLLTLSPAQTASLAVGEYAWQMFAEKDDEKVFVTQGVLQIKPGFSATNADQIFDGRSQTKRILDAIDAMVLGKASLDQQSYVIGNRQLQRIPISELIVLRGKYQQMHNREKLAERAKNGSGILKTHLVRMKGE